MGEKDSDWQTQAATWLELVDQGDGRTSWETAGASFKSAVTAESWTQQLADARLPLGLLTSRQVAVEQRMNGLPGEAQGEYVVQQYHAVYNGAKAVTETVTLQLESDGIWRVVGYYIR